LNVIVQYQGAAPTCDLFLVPGRNLISGLGDFATEFGAPTSLEEDLLTLAGSIYAADIATKRGEREQFTRDFKLQIPVVNYDAFIRLADDLIDILYFLTSDNWEIIFTRRDGHQEPRRDWGSGRGTTLLFSGGLDSFAAAVAELTAGSSLQLVSHFTANRVVRESQERLHAHLDSTFRRAPKRIPVRAGGRNRGGLRFPSDQDREPTQRTRTFLFLVIAALVARRTEFSNLLMVGENGQMAIHLPLTPARIGAFSTHTAHPEFLNSMQQYLSALLRVQLAISNPFLYKTKSEVIEPLVSSRRHRRAIRQSVSCWGAGRHAFSHCGECIPCIVRRIALEDKGVRLREYARDLFREDILQLSPEDAGKRNLLELAEFAVFFLTLSDAGLEDKFPEVINPSFDKTEAISMYRRFASEARNTFRRYPGLATLLP
jgi:7-cyano-7-deazaguanine synthase in queuosine biosynthesis